MRPLEVTGLTVTYPRRQPPTVLSEVSLTVAPGEIVGLIGETGSGKTTLARAIAGLAPVSGGSVRVGGTDVTALRGRALRAFRRTGAVQLMFQDPMRALNPRLTVASIVAEPLRIAGTDRIPERVAEALDAVGLDPGLADRRPGEISGGQRQRALLARAIAPRPRLLIADEPVSALDASHRNHVLRLLDALRTRTGLAVLVISHDLSSLAGIADRVAVLYGGHLVETGPIADVLHEPAHPYTALLTASAPLVTGRRSIPLAALRTAPGRLPPAAGGCAVAARCRFADDACHAVPPLLPAPGDRSVACHHASTWRSSLLEATP